MRTNTLLASFFSAGLVLAFAAKAIPAMPLELSPLALQPMTGSMRPDFGQEGPTLSPFKYDAKDYGLNHYEQEYEPIDPGFVYDPRDFPDLPPIDTKDPSYHYNPADGPSPAFLEEHPHPTAKEILAEIQYREKIMRDEDDQENASKEEASRDEASEEEASRNEASKEDESKQASADQASADQASAAQASAEASAQEASTSRASEEAALAQASQEAASQASQEQLNDAQRAQAAGEDAASQAAANNSDSGLQKPTGPLGEQPPANGYLENSEGDHEGYLGVQYRQEWDNENYRGDKFLSDQEGPNAQRVAEALGRADAATQKADEFQDRLQTDLFAQTMGLTGFDDPKSDQSLIDSYLSAADQWVDVAGALGNAMYGQIVAMDAVQQGSATTGLFVSFNSGQRSPIGPDPFSMDDSGFLSNGHAFDGDLDIQLPFMKGRTDFLNPQESATTDILASAISRNLGPTGSVLLEEPYRTPQGGFVTGEGGKHKIRETVWVDGRRTVTDPAWTYASGIHFHVDPGKTGYKIKAPWDWK